MYTHHLLPNEPEDPDDGEGEPEPPAVESVTVSPKTNNLEVGGTRQLNVSVTPDDAEQDVAWATSNRQIVAVNDSGLIEAVAAGSVNIEVTAGGVTDTATVNVKELEPEPEEGE